MARRYYANAAPQRTLAGTITAGATSLTVSGSFAGWPVQFPFYAALDIGTASFELVSVTNIVGSTATIVRAQDGTAAISHPGGATMDQVIVRQDLDEASAHINASAGVHGVSGSVVGTNDVQTVSNKTLTNPTINGANVTGTIAGTLTASGLTATSPNLVTPSITKGVHNGDATATPAITAQAGSGTTKLASYKTAAAVETASIDAVTGFNGVVVPKTFTNEAAATAAGANVTGAEVWLSTPTTAGTAAGVFVYSGAAWIPYKRPRVGARATTTAAQTINASSTTTLNNGGAAVWTATEDSGGFVSGVSGTTTPIIIPAGLGGLYQVGLHYVQAANSATRLLAQPVVNGSVGTNWFTAYGEAVSNGSIPIPLNAGDTLGMAAFSSTATTTSIGCQLFCYRISD